MTQLSDHDRETIRAILRGHHQALQPEPTGLAPRLKPLDGLRAVVFDIYGTLLISGVGDVGTTIQADRSEVFHDVLVEFLGEDVATRPDVDFTVFTEVISAHHERSRNAGIAHPEVDIVAVWHEVLDRLGLTHALEDGALSRLAVEFETRTNPVWRMPHARECLEAVRARGLRLGIVSNAQFFTPELFPCLFGQSLNELGFDERLQFFSYEYGHAKPGLLLFEKLAAALNSDGIEPAEAVYVGNDMLNDVYAAQQIGFRTALFAGDARSLRLRDGDPRTDGVAADVILTDFSQLATCFPDDGASR